jgi:hypothetical protein
VESAPAETVAEAPQPIPTQRQKQTMKKPAAKKTTVKKVSAKAPVRRPPHEDGAVG